MKKLNKVLLLVMVLLLVVVGSVDAAPALRKDAYKNGDIISVIVPFSAGGGFDRVVRMMLPFLKTEIKNITGANVDFMVDNMAGGTGVPGNTAIYKARPDGKTFGLVATAGTPYLQLVHGGFDFETYTAISLLSSEPAIWVVAGDSDIKDVNDFIERSQKQSMLIGTSGVGAIEHMSTLITQSVLAENGIKMNVDFVHYAGTADVAIAVIKKEVDGAIMSSGGQIEAIRNGDLKGLALLDTKRHEWMPNVPTVVELGLPGAEKLAEGLGQNRALVGPPNIPADILAVLETAVLNVLSNSEFKRLAEAGGLDLHEGAAASAAACHELLVRRITIARENEALVKEVFKK